MFKISASESQNGVEQIFLLSYMKFIHSSVVCLTTGPKPPPKRCLHTVPSRASSFKWVYPLLSLRSSSSFLRLLPHLLATSISPFIFPSITRFRRQFLRKMWPIQLAFRFLISCRIFLCSLALSNTSSFLTWSVQLIFSILTPLHQPGRDSSVGKATAYGLDGLGIESRWRRAYLHPSRPALGPIQPRVQWIPGLYPGVKATGAWRWPPTTHLVPRSWKGRAIPLLSLWASVAC